MVHCGLSEYELEVLLLVLCHMQNLQNVNISRQCISPLLNPDLQRWAFLLVEQKIPLQ